MTIYQVYGNPTDLYLHAPGELEVVVDGDFVGYARRTGITPPHYPDRAVYKFKEEYYVYEGGKLFPTNEWKDRNRI